MKKPVHDAGGGRAGRDLTPLPGAPRGWGSQRRHGPKRRGWPDRDGADEGEPDVLLEAG